jgi:hypothetical protein
MRKVFVFQNLLLLLIRVKRMLKAMDISQMKVLMLEEPKTKKKKTLSTLVITGRLLV